MMRVSALELVLTAERQRRQASNTGTGFARPVLREQTEDAVNAPFLVSNSRGSFVLGRRHPTESTVRFAFTERPITEETPLLVELFRALWATSVQQSWSNRCSSISQATARMVALGLEASALIVSTTFLEEACGKALTDEDAERLMMMQGFVAEVEGVKVLASGLPTGTAILASPRASLGTYIRADDQVAILIRRADRSLVLVGEDGSVA